MSVFTILLLHLPFIVSIDWTQFGFNQYRSGHNDNEVDITPSAFNSGKTLAMFWNFPFDGAALSQPLYISDVPVSSGTVDFVLIGNSYGLFYGIDAATGTAVWVRKDIGTYRDSSCSEVPEGRFGVGGTGYIDESSVTVFVAGGTGNLHRLNIVDGSSYSSSWPMMGVFDYITEYMYGAISMYNDTLYITTTGRCGGSSYQGKVMAIDIVSATVLNTFIPANPLNGAGISGAGGVSIDPVSDSVFVATGNILNYNSAYPDFGNSLFSLTLTSQTPLSNLKASYQPQSNQGQSSRYEFSGTPVVFTPTNECSTTLLATENEAGYLLITDTDLSIYQKIQIMKPDSDAGDFVASPVFDSGRNVLYVANPGTNQDLGIQRGIVALSVQSDCTLIMAWNSVLATSSSNARWASPVIGGDLVYVTTGSSGQIFALHADTGDVLWSSAEDMGFIYAPPTVVDGKVFVIDSGPNFAGSGCYLWTYTLQTAGTPAPTEKPIESFYVTINGKTFDLTQIATTGSVDSSNMYTQRLFSFTDIYFDEYYFRLPVGGLADASGLPVSLDWSNTDFWLNDYSLGYVMIGKYDAKTWVQREQGVASVLFTGGTFCRESGIFREANVTFICSHGSDTQYEVERLGSCKIAVRVKSDSVCLVFPWVYSNTANIIINSKIIDITSIASSGSLDSTANVFEQKVYSFGDSKFVYFFHVPAGGIPVTTGLTGIWTWSVPYESDFWQISMDFGYAYSLGTYDPNSWMMLADGSLRVLYTQGDFCSENIGSTDDGYANDYYSYYDDDQTRRKAMVTFLCGDSSVNKYVMTKSSSCVYHVNVTNIAFCGPKTSSPTQTPVASPTYGPYEFFVLINGRYVEVTRIASSGSYDESNVLEQRVFTYDAPGEYQYFFRVPAGGVSVTTGLYGGWTWDRSDFWRLTDDFLYGVSLGVYDADSWRVLEDGSLSVQYEGGDVCDRLSNHSYSSNNTLYSASATFSCGTETSFNYSLTMESSCIYHMRVSSSEFCELFSNAPSAYPTVFETDDDDDDTSSENKSNDGSSANDGSNNSNNRNSSSMMTEKGASSSNTVLTCINLAMEDSFGDGWGLSRLLLYPSRGDPVAVFPSCGDNVVKDQFCFSSEVHMSGDVVVMSVMGYHPSYSWEIFWQTNIEGTKMVYSGSYATSLTFVYETEENKRSIRIVKSANLLSTQMLCATCKGYNDRQVILSNKDVHKDFSSVHRHLTGQSKKGVGSLFLSQTSSSLGSSASHSLTEVSTGLFGKVEYSISASNTTWYHSTGEGASLYISSEDGYNLFYSGGLCHEKAHRACSFEEPMAGRYMWRVAGAGQSGITWQFCGVSGNARTELLFDYQNGECTVVNARKMSNICEALEAETETEAEAAMSLAGSVSLRGSIQLHGVDPTDLSVSELDTLRHILAEELQDASPSPSSQTLPQHVQLTCGEEVKISSDRALSFSRSTKTALVSFKILFNTHKNTVHTEDALAHELHLYLKRSMASGLFITRLKARLRNTNAEDSVLDLINLAILQNIFAEHELRINERLSASSSIVVTIGTGCGVLFSILLVSYLWHVMSNDRRENDITGQNALAQGIEIQRIHDNNQHYTSVSVVSDDL